MANTLELGIENW